MQVNCIIMTPTQNVKTEPNMKINQLKPASNLFIKSSQKLKNRVLRIKESQIHINQVIKIITIATKVGGMHVHEKNWKPNINFWFLILDIFSFLIVGFYTITRVWNVLDELCLFLANLNFFIHGIYLIQKFIQSKDTVRKLYHSAVDLVNEFKPLTQEGQCVLRYRQILGKIVKATVIAHFCIIIIIYLYIIIGSIIFMELVLPFGFYLPFVNEKNAYGFLLNLIYQSIQIVFVAAGFIALQVTTELLIIVAACRCEILIIKFNQLENIIISNTNNSIKIYHNKLINCIKYHQGILNFLQDCEEMFSSANSVAFLCYDFQIIFLLFVCAKEFYPPGYALIAFATLILLAICLIGTFIQQRVRFRIHL